jgi:hydroxymethylbilane synthase
MRNPIIVGTRASPLAQRQTEEVLNLLKSLYPQINFMVKKIKTKGDRVGDIPLPRIGGKGLFIKEIDQALLSTEIDLAVHSFKDLPTELLAGLEIAAFTPRLDPRDVLVTAGEGDLDSLPPGSVIGTSSPRRIALVKAVRPDLVLCPLRGNLDTRLRKILRGEIMAAILAAAGLIRMGWQSYITQYLPPEVFVPAVGQGALAVEVRSDDEEIKKMLHPLDHHPTRIAISAERAFLRHLGGGCHIPIAALGEIRGANLRLIGMVALPSGERLVRAEMEGEAGAADELGKRLEEHIMNIGGREIIEEACKAKSIW